MSKKKNDDNPFIEAFKKLSQNHTPVDVEAVIKEILIANGLFVENVLITTSQKNRQGLGKGKGKGYFTNDKLQK